MCESLSEAAWAVVMPNNSTRINGLEGLGALGILLGFTPPPDKADCDCENCRAKREIKTAPDLNLDSLPDAVQNVVKGFKDRPVIKEAKVGGGRGLNRYNIATDTVLLDNYTERRDVADFTRLLFHELAHATGARHRLNRGNESKGARAYALEEVVAELTAQALLKHCGLWRGTVVRVSNAYLVNYANEFWDKEKTDIDAVIREARPFVKAAVKYILGKGANASKSSDKRELVAA